MSPKQLSTEAPEAEAAVPVSIQLRLPCGTLGNSRVHGPFLSFRAWQEQCGCQRGFWEEKAVEEEESGKGIMKTMNPYLRRAQKMVCNVIKAPVPP